MPAQSRTGDHHRRRAEKPSAVMVDSSNPLTHLPPRGLALPTHENRRATPDLLDEGIDAPSLNLPGNEPNRYQGLMDGRALGEHPFTCHGC